jgi:predicted transcriptional regulator
MTGYDFLFALGKYGIAVIAICAVLVFFCVFLLAQPGGEISFLGIKFHKRRTPWNFSAIFRLPRLRTPESWMQVLQAFAEYDEDSLRQEDIFTAMAASGLSKNQIKSVFDEMHNAGLLEPPHSHVHLTEKGRKQISMIDTEKRGTRKKTKERGYY